MERAAQRVAGSGEELPIPRCSRIILDIDRRALLVELEREGAILGVEQVARAAVPVAHQRLAAFARHLNNLVRRIGVPDHIHTPRAAEAIPIGAGHIAALAVGDHLLERLAGQHAGHRAVGQEGRFAQGRTVRIERECAPQQPEVELVLALVVGRLVVGCVGR